LQLLIEGLSVSLHGVNVLLESKFVCQMR